MSEEQKMYPLHLRVLNQWERLTRYPISAIGFIGHGGVKKLPMYPEERFLKCPLCGHHDFIEGIAVNHYECDGCNTGYQVWPA